MRVLIVGGGVAGLSLAALLGQQGSEPVVIERAGEYGERGYGISLYPFGSAVLHGLSAYSELAAAATEMKTYEIADRSGEVTRSIDFARLTSPYGPTLLTSRHTLIEILREAAGDRIDLRMGTTLTGLEQAGNEVETTFGDGRVERFDLVVGADGIDSATRALLFEPQPRFETGWVGWTWWGRAEIFPPHTVREHWLAGALFGAYPTPGRTMFLVAVPSAVAPPESMSGNADVKGRLCRALGRSAERPEIASALKDASELWPWPLYDVRSGQLARGRVILCGDAGTAFLPTAGVGASSALRSAAALADELSRADARSVPLAIDHYLERTTKQMRANQRDSRHLARAMFVENALACRARDELVRRLPMKTMVGSILAAMEQPI